MTNNMGRPKVVNPKNIDLKVRFDEETNKKILDHCNAKNITRTNLIRQGTKNQIALENGLEHKDIEQYEIYLEKLSKEDFDTFDIRRVEDEISRLNGKLDELYGIVTNLRDKYLYEEYDMEYDEAFKRGITVSMPINADIFFVQNSYYRTIMRLYDIRTKIKFR